MSKELLDNIAEHLKDEKSKLAIEQLIGALDSKRDLVLPIALKEKLDAVKENPLEAKEVADKRKEIDKMLEDGELDSSEVFIEILGAVATTDELNKLYKDGVTLAELNLLGEEIQNKVFYHKYLDENNNFIFKEVDSHKEMEILSFYERKEIRTLSKKVVSIQNKILEIHRSKIELLQASKQDEMKKIVDDATEEINKLADKGKLLKEEVEEKIFKYAKLDKKDMTEWEQGLLIAKVKEMAEDRYTPPKGKN